MAAVFGAALVAVPGYAADDLVVEAERRGEAVEVRARATIAAPMPLVWRVLTDYEDLPRFIPGIAKSIVRQHNGNRLLVDHSGEARLLFFSIPIEVTLEVTESPFDWIASRAVGGNVRRMNARYDLSAGNASGTVVLRYYGLIEPDFALPPLIGVVAMRLMVEEQFAAMVGEIERRAAAGGRK